MRRPLRLIVLAGLAVIVFAAAAQAQRAEPLERGRSILDRQCSRCHAIDRSDASRLPAAPPFRDLNRKYPVENLAEAFAEGIITGHPAMPIFKFTPPEIDAIIAYMKSLGAP